MPDRSDAQATAAMARSGGAVTAIATPAGREPAAGDAAANPDHLQACLAYVVKANGLPFSPASALAGLPMAPGEHLTVPLFARAAQRCGLKAEPSSRAPSRVPALLVPFVVPLADGTACVVVDLDVARDTATVVMPDAKSLRHRVPLADLDRQGTGTVILVARDERAEDATSPRRAHWFWAGIVRLWPSWVQVAVAALIINILGLAVPIFVMTVYDRVIPNQTLPTLWSLTAGVALALVFDLMLRQLRAVVLDQAGGLIDLRASSLLFEQALAMPMSERQQPTGSLASQIREFDSVRDFFASSSIVAFIDLMFIGVVLVVMWMILGPVALVPLAALPVVILLALVIQLPLARAVRSTQAQAARRHAIMVESLAGIETVKTVGAEGMMQRRWDDAVAASVRAGSSTRLWSSLTMNLVSLVQQAVGVIIVVWGVYLSAEGLITVGGIIAASMLSGRVLAPMSSVALTLSRAQASFLAMKGLDGLMNRPRESTGQGAGVDIADGSVEFRHVDFTFPQASLAALSDVSFAIRSGERVGIVGPMGSGKSTLGRLLDALWQPSSGTILVGGREIRSVAEAELRAWVGFMPQEVELYSGTLFDNIVMGARDIDPAAITRACDIAGVSDFARLHPMGLKMPIGERGRGLSGGQRQTVALARVILRQPPVLFLDEPSSAMDTTSEANLVRRLKEWAGAGHTVIISSQRLAMLELCDRLIVLDGGRVVADGPKGEIVRLLSGRSVSRQAG